ncbi:MAG: hypothetical protein JSS30_06145 [Verrucomicrobia bacterium]|nr:hypothetical protein [Verrucomicrobiota bacterium]
MKKMLITLGILMVCGVAVVLIAQAENEVLPEWMEESPNVWSQDAKGDTPELIQESKDRAEEKVQDYYLSPQGQAELRARSGGK